MPDPVRYQTPVPIAALGAQPGDWLHFHPRPHGCRLVLSREYDAETVADFFGALEGLHEALDGARALGEPPKPAAAPVRRPALRLVR